MIQWLTEHGIHTDDKMLKAELYAQILLHKKQVITYKIDSMIEEPDIKF